MKLDLSKRSTQEAFVNESIEQHGSTGLLSTLMLFASAARDERFEAEGKEPRDGNPARQDLAEAFVQLWNWAAVKHVKCSFE